MDGKLAGINTAIYSRSGGSVGIGFAIPANMVAAFLAAQKSGGHLDRPWIGVSGQGVTADMAEALGLDHPTGIVVDDIYPGGPGAAAGLKQGDVIIAIDGKAIEDPGSLRFRLATMTIGSQATLTVLRDRRQMDLAIRLASAPESPPTQKTQLTGAQPLAGATVGNLSPALADQLQLNSDWKGVVILKIRRGSTAQRFGLAPGDIIAAVNGHPVATVDELQAALAGADHWEIAFQRNGETRTLKIE
jgi:serine protease Do